MQRMFMTLVKGFVIVGGLALACGILFMASSGSAKPAATSASQPAQMSQCFKGAAVAYYLDQPDKGSATVGEAGFDAGTQVAVIGSAKDRGDIELKVPGVAFIYRGKTYTARAADLGPCK